MWFEKLVDKISMKKEFSLIDKIYVDQCDACIVNVASAFSVTKTLDLYLKSRSSQKHSIRSKMTKDSIRFDCQVFWTYAGILSQLGNIIYDSRPSANFKSLKLHFVTTKMAKLLRFKYLMTACNRNNHIFINLNYVVKFYW